MDVYFSPLACSLASRITLYETGQNANFHRVDTKAGKTASGEDYRKINPKGLVPALRTETSCVSSAPWRSVPTPPWKASS